MSEVKSDFQEEWEIRKAVKDLYSQLALKGSAETCCNPSECCSGDSFSDVGVPPEALEVSAGCKSPVGYADIKEGETVLDIGSGGGIDVFRASSLVGPFGRVIGVDATPEMVWRARQTARKHGYSNVEFRLGEMEHLPIEANSVDVVISNCAINLVPDKEAAFREAFRVLRPGGRLVVADVVAVEPLPHAVEADPQAWSKCISGALEEGEYFSAIKRAGFVNACIIESHGYSAAYSNTTIKLATVVIAALKPELKITPEER